MRKREILRCWEERYGRLSAPSRDRFLKRSELSRLIRYPDDTVRRSIAFSSLLSDALSFAASELHGEGAELPPEPRPESNSAPPPAAPRVVDDRALRQQIGAVQNYDDTL